MLSTIWILVLIPFFIVVFMMKLNQFVDWPWLEKLLLKADGIILARRKSRKPILEFSIAGIVVLFAFLASARMKPSAPYEEACIYVVADQPVWEKVQGHLKMSLERIIRTPQEEKELFVRHITSENVRFVKRHRHLIFIDASNSQKTMDSIVEELLSSSHCTTNSIVWIRDHWSRDQITAVITGDIPDIIDTIDRHADSLYSAFRSDLAAYIGEQLSVSVSEQRQSKQILEEYGWTIKKLSDFYPVHVDDSTDNGFIMFNSPSPHVWMFIRWMHFADASCLSEDWIVAERNRITGMHYDSMTVANHYLVCQHDNFQGMPALLTTGLWELEKPASGGPFQNITFFDSKIQRLYMIDSAVYAPEKPKLPFLRTNEAIMYSFRISDAS